MLKVVSFALVFIASHVAQIGMAKESHAPANDRLVAPHAYTFHRVACSKGATQCLTDSETIEEKNLTEQNVYVVWFAATQKAYFVIKKGGRVIVISDKDKIPASVLMITEEEGKYYKSTANKKDNDRGIFLVGTEGPAEIGSSLTLAALVTMERSRIQAPTVICRT